MRRSWKPWSTGDKGFTVIELVVSLLVASVAMLVTLFISNGMTKQLRNTKNSVTAQSNARIAVDEITRQLRGAGSGTDYSNGQTRLLYAAPFTVAFNANMQPIDDPAGNGEPAALDVTLADATVTLEGGDTYTAPMTFGTGAETIVLTLDSNRDGAISAADASDDAEEASDNPTTKSSSLSSCRVGAATARRRRYRVLRGTAVDGVPLWKRSQVGSIGNILPASGYTGRQSDGKMSSTSRCADRSAADQLALIGDRGSLGADREARHGESLPTPLQRSSSSFTVLHGLACVDYGHDLDSDGRGPGELGIRDASCVRATIARPRPKWTSLSVV